MAYRDGPLQDLKVPLIWAGAIAAVIAGCIALGLLLTDRPDRPNGGTYASARGEFDEALQPVSGVLSWPVRALGSVGQEIGGYFDAIGQNRRLRARIKDLERVRDEAVMLRNTNTRYEQLLRLRTEPPAPMITARVITDSRGPFSNARLADAGSENGVKVGYPVVSDHGAVGRVVGVAQGVSRILLLTDVDSRTPVLVDRTGSRAILTGDGGGAPRLEYLRGPSPVKPGDVVLTSGDGGVFPRGLPVGVAAQDLRGGWRVRLYADAQDIDYVRILEVDDFAKLAQQRQAELNAKVAPPLPPPEAAQLQAATAAKAAPAVAAFSGIAAGAAIHAPKPAAEKPSTSAAPSAPKAATPASSAAPPSTTAPKPKPSAVAGAAKPKPATAGATPKAKATTSPGTAAKKPVATRATAKPKPAARTPAKLPPAKTRMAPIPNPPGGGA